MNSNWILCDNDETVINSIAEELGINRLTAAIAFHRGITSSDSARNFFEPESAQPFHDPFEMKGMTVAVDRIVQAIDRGERIVVYGDYDVDGMTASAILIKCLRRLGAAEVGAYIPSRQTEGYGFNVEALQSLVGNYELLISVDCGITNDNELETIKGALDVIITDHHLPSGEVKNALAVLDPHQPDCNYPDKNLCGAGVAFKLCQALNCRLDGIDYRTYVEDIELAALGTVADLVPLMGENRKIVRLGLERMSSTANVGLKELIAVARLEGKKLNAGHCGYSLGPRLNAIGRLQVATIGLELLLTNTPLKAQRLATMLDRENTQRKQLEARMIAEADEAFQRRRSEAGGGLSSIVIAREDWHKGVVGLTASRLVERYYLPTIIIALDGDLAVGSCRSIMGLHMKEALDHFSDRFMHYGGHEMAAGLTMAREGVESFARDFDDYVRTKLSDEQFMPTVKLDAEIEPTAFTIELVEELEKLAPFGIGNPHPKFGCRNVQGRNARAIGSDAQHLSFDVETVIAADEVADDQNPSEPEEHFETEKIAEPDMMFFDIDGVDEGAAMFGDFDSPIDFYEDDDDRVDWLDEGVGVSDKPVEIKKTVRAVGWGMGSLASLVNTEPINIIFEPNVNEYNGERSVQCVVSSIEPDGSNDRFPDRAALGRIYKFLRSYARGETFKPFDICRIASAFRNSTAAFDNPALNSIYTMACAVEVFGEIGLIHFDADRKNFRMPVPTKTFDLNRSRLFTLNIGGGANERQG